MGERKVLNKYYPPDFETIRLPKLPGGRPDQYVIRIMAPFTMRCLTCGNYVYKGRKFNSRKEDAKGEKYLGIQIYRFYIRCPECLSEITFKTDPQNSDYVPEHGAIRTFQAERLAELEEQRAVEEQEEEEANNPMLALENRTAESRREMDVLDALEEIRDWNSRTAAVKHEHLLEGLISAEEKETEEAEAELKAQAAKIFEEKRTKLRRLEEHEEAPPTKRHNLATQFPRQPVATKKNKLLDLVVKKSDKAKYVKQEPQNKNLITVEDERDSKGSIISHAGGSKTSDPGGSKTSDSGCSKTSDPGGLKPGLAMLCSYSDSDSD